MNFHPRRALYMMIFCFIISEVMYNLYSIHQATVEEPYYGPVRPNDLVKPNESDHIILAWTPIFDSWDNWYPDWKEEPGGRGYRPFHNSLCHYDDCFLTMDAAHAHRADAVLFHCRDDFPDWPEVRSERQLYGVVCHESPMASNFSGYGARMNLTITYRRDSDIFFPNCWFVRRAELNRDYKPRVPMADRRYDVVWPVSNCHADSHREKYVEVLQTFIHVHVYGKCGNYTCPRSEQCLEYFGKNYKFYISFENAVCEDYVSEKFALPLQNELIPIVLGGQQFKDFPKHSYIDIRDFESPKALGKYLSYLATNETAYNEYFEWRKTFELNCSNKDKLFCDLCEMIRNKGKRKQYPDVNKWWSENRCDNSLVPRIINYAKLLQGLLITVVLCLVYFYFGRWYLFHGEILTT